MNMITITERAANIGEGTVLLLDVEQYGRRRHQVELLKADEKAAQFIVRLTAPTQMKIGERFGYEGEVPKGLLHVTDDAALPPQPSKLSKPEKASKAALEKARDEGFAEGRKQMLAEIKLRNELLDAKDVADARLTEARNALKTADASADKKALEVDVAEAQKVADELAAQIAELPSLEG